MYTYDQLQAMAVHRLGEAPSDKDTLPAGALPGSYGGTALGTYVGLHVHTAMPDQVHVVDGKPTPGRLFRTRKLAQVYPDHTWVLIPRRHLTHHQRATLAQLPGPIAYAKDWS